MLLRPIPHRKLLLALTSVAVAIFVLLLAGVSVATSGYVAGAALLTVLIVCVIDYRTTTQAWTFATPTLTRNLPAALALGVERPIRLSFAVQGEQSWQVRVYDHFDPTLLTHDMPVELTLAANQITDVEYRVRPSLRGNAKFSPAELRIRSRFGFLELTDYLGREESRRVYPDFAQVARYAWLAGDRRLAEIGIKTYHQRGEGTDFKQLAEYRVGDQVRHVDWKASMRHEKLIVRQFQNERDQCVLLLLDCGRRMRADDRTNDIGTSHFDQVLNAVMLLTYVALKQGDAVGTMTFGTPSGEERWFAPRKGASVLNAMMSELFAVQPTPTHSDYLAAAQELLRRHHKRSLVIFVTNYRDEDAVELDQALRLLRSRHLVLTASLRERVVGELIAQPLAGADAPLEIASAHLYEQSRRDTFSRIATRGGLTVDAEPQRLGIELVNRYQALKKAGMI